MSSEDVFLVCIWFTMFWLGNKLDEIIDLLKERSNHERSV